MAPPPRHVPSPSPRPRSGGDRSMLTRGLRFEWASEEGRPLLVSHAIATAVAIIWLLLVAFMPPSEPAISLMSPEEAQPVEITFEDPTNEPVAAAPVPAAQPAAQPREDAAAAAAAAAERRRARENAAIAGAFGGPPQQGRGGMVGDVSNVLRGVDVKAAGDAGGPSPQGKAVIAYGEGGQGSRTPGRDGLGMGSAAAGNIGGVGGGGEGVSRSTVRVSAPTMIRAERVGGPSRDVGELGNYVRGRQSQIRFCYEEYGLKVNPSLAGTVTVSITMTGNGNVTEAAITNRTWSGPGSAEAESCIRSRIGAWRFPASDQGGGTYSFPFNFTR
jgi:hypothetical protein